MGRLAHILADITGRLAYIIFINDIIIINDDEDIHVVSSVGVLFLANHTNLHIVNAVGNTSFKHVHHAADTAKLHYFAMGKRR